MNCPVSLEYKLALMIIERSLVFLGVNIPDFVKYDQNINILEYVYIDKIFNDV